ncbi:MAG: hypothetical protein ACXVFF_14335 [Gaiellaceae bacterium]
MGQSSAQRKLARGVEHVKTLCGEARTFEHGDAYVPDTKRNIRSAQEVEYIVTAIENLRPKPEWPLLAGEAVHNLRGALDHAVYALTPPKYRGGCQFPIFSDPCEFQVKGRPMIRGIPTPIATLIEAAQPYKRLPPRPALDPLAVLNSFSNRDKHRELSTVVSLLNFSYVGAPHGVRIQWNRQRHHPTLHHGAQIARFTAISNEPFDEMQVDPRFTYEICVKGRPLVSTLVAIAQRVFEAVTEAETGNPISPRAQYPIYAIEFP